MTATIALDQGTLDDAKSTQESITSVKMAATRFLMGWYFQKSDTCEQPVSISGPVYSRNAEKALRITRPYLWRDRLRTFLTIVSLTGMILGIVGTAFIGLDGSPLNEPSWIGATCGEVILIFWLVYVCRACGKYNPGKDVIELALYWKKALQQMEKLGLVDNVMDQIFPSPAEDACMHIERVQRAARTFEIEPGSRDKYGIRSAF